MRRSILAALAAIVLTLGPLVLWGCGEKVTAPTSVKTTSGSLRITSMLEMSDSLVAALPSEALQEMTGHGWMRTAQGFERHEDATVFTDYHPIR